MAVTLAGQFIYYGLGLNSLKPGELFSVNFQRAVSVAVVGFNPDLLSLLEALINDYFACGGILLHDQDGGKRHIKQSNNCQLALAMPTWRDVEKLLKLISRTAWGLIIGVVKE
ncbi:hypothetical protein L2E82_46066 [Cichorium intybus]|uniref:Uncharacterized protein n=1 Tax=Cichorium intybus TaxID=13427 RepID=A0ACB8YSS0_CICIN|nr:hypothetical protein L2E82_46066 [Cichorium intybus]